MSGRFFLDTNLFVYLFDRTAPRKAERAGQLIRRALDSGQGVISYQVVQEFFNVAFRRFPKPLTPEEGERYFTVTFRPLLSVHSSNNLYLEAFQLRSRYRFSWYDALIVAAALESGCSTLFSEDFQHGLQVGELRIEDPFRK